MPRLIIRENSIDPSEDVVIETDNVCEALENHFGEKLPDNTRIYHQFVATEYDVTPGEADVDHDVEFLQSLDGDIYCITYPQFFLFGLGLIGKILGIFLLGLITYLLRPKPPKERNTGNDSPNNGLSDRQNTARPNARIPDIYGQVRSVPDLIAKPYRYYEQHREKEISYMCVGRGEFEISDIKDDTTPITDISGIQYAIYGPGTNPNSGTPQVEYGTEIQDLWNVKERVWSATKSNAVTGQILRAPNASLVDGDEDIAFNDPDQIVTNNSDLNFEEYFAIDDVLILSNTVSGDNTLNLDGTYTVLSLTSTTITLDNPGAVNANWNTSFGSTQFSDAQLRTNSDKWIGPFIVVGARTILNNFVALNGLYMEDNEQRQYTMGVNIEVEFWPVDENGDAIGPVEDETVNINGSAELKNTRAVTSNYTVDQPVADSYTSRWKVRARRETEHPVFTDRRVVDEVQWQDLYGLGYVPNTHDFGNVTTVFVKTAATTGALSIKERKFNCLAWRKITGRDSSIPNGGAPWYFTDDVVTQRSGTLIIRDIALDPYLGNMTEDQLDYNSIFGAEAFNQNYFGTVQTRQFNHTFDDKSLTAEEMILAVADAIFCTAYRQGNQLKLSFEGKTELSTMLFNHRNKVPGTELRTIRFGNNDDHDGVDFDWVNSDDGAIETFQIPTNGSAINPQKIEMAGIQHIIQAHMHAYRAYWKILYRNTAVEFEATAEANLLIQNDKIVVSDNTRQDTYDGEVIAQNGLTLTLSNEIPFRSAESYTIFLTHYDKTVEALDILFGSTRTTVRLRAAPRLPLVFDQEKYARTGYVVVRNGDSRPYHFLVQEKEPQDNFTCVVRAHNYDDRFYQNDQDYNNGVFDDETSTIIFREDFESLDCPAGTFRHYISPGNFTSTNAIEIQNNYVGVGPAAQGQKHCELDGTNKMWVDLTTDGANTYELILFYSARPYIPANECRIDIYWDGNFFMTLEENGLLITTTDWKSIFVDLPTPTSDPTRLEFRSITDGGLGQGGLLDDIRVREIS